MAGVKGHRVTAAEILTIHVRVNALTAQAEQMYDGRPMPEEDLLELQTTEIDRCLMALASGARLASPTGDPGSAPEQDYIISAPTRRGARASSQSGYAPGTTTSSVSARDNWQNNYGFDVVGDVVRTASCPAENRQTTANIWHKFAKRLSKRALILRRWRYFGATGMVIMYSRTKGSGIMNWCKNVAGLTNHLQSKKPLTAGGHGLWPWAGW